MVKHVDSRLGAPALLSSRLMLPTFFALLFAFLGAQAAPGQLTVAVANGDTAGLIAAIQSLNANGGGTINLASSGSYIVSAPSDWWYGPNAFPAIASTITINGNGATISRAAASPNFRFFYVSGGFSTLPAGNLTLNNLTLTGGLAMGGNGGTGSAGGGGGAGMGGAVYNQGVFLATSVLFSSNTAQGGAGGGTNYIWGEGGGGGMGANGGNGANYGYNVAGSGGGFRYAGVTAPVNSYATGGAFAGNEGGQSPNGGTSAFGGNGSAAGFESLSQFSGTAGGGGGGYAPGATASGGYGAYGGGNGGCCDPYSVDYAGGGGAFGGGGGSGYDSTHSGGGGGVGGGGVSGGGGGYGGGGGGSNLEGSVGAASVFGGGAGGYSSNNKFPGGSPGFGGASGGTNACSSGICGLPGPGGGGAGMGGAVFNQLGTVTLQSGTLTGNSAVGGGGNGTSDGFGGALFNLNGNMTLNTVTYSGNLATNSAGAADSGSVAYNLSHNGGNVAANQIPTAILSLYGTTISTSNGSLVNNQVNGTALAGTPATVTLSNLTQTYTGSALVPTVKTSPAGLSVILSGGPQTNAGTYTVTATISAAGYFGSATATFVIQPAAATVNLGNLTTTYTGSPISPSVTTIPAGLPVVLTGAPQTNAGNYQVIANVNSPNYTGTATGTLMILPAPATLALGSLSQTYTGSPLTPSVVTVPANLPVVWTGAPQTNAGSYSVTATISSPNYTGSATGNFVIQPAAATVTLASLTQIYTGSPLTPSVVTVPANLPVVWTGAPQTNVGSYSVIATIYSSNYTGSASGTLVIQPATAQIVASNLTQTYTGSTLAPTIATVPAGLSVTTTLVSPINAGSYPFTATIHNANYTGSATGTFIIAPEPVSFALTGSYIFNGLPQTPTVTPSVPGVSFSLTGAGQTNAGTYPVTVTATNPNYVGSASLPFVINPYPVTLTVQATPLYYKLGTLGPNYPPPPACTGIAAPCVQDGDFVQFSAQLSPASIGGQSALLVSSCGGSNQACATLTLTGPAGVATPAVLPLTGSSASISGSITLKLWTIPGPYASSAVPISPNPNFVILPTIAQFNVAKRAASITYTGLTDFTVSGSSSTEPLTFTYSVTDAGKLPPSDPNRDFNIDDVNNAQFLLTLSGSAPTASSYIAACGPQSVSGDANPPRSPLGNGTLTCTLPAVPVNGTYTLSVAAGPQSYYYPADGSTSITITDGNNGAGSVSASGYQSAAYLGVKNYAAGKYAPGGLLLPAAGTNVNFRLASSYLTTPEAALTGDASVTIVSQCLKDLPDYVSDPGGDGLCVYEIKSHTVENLSIYPAKGHPTYATFSATAVIQDVKHEAPITVAKEVQLQMQMYSPAAGQAGQNTLAILANNPKQGLWFSNNWSGTNTKSSAAAPVLQSGTLTVNPN